MNDRRASRFALEVLFLVALAVGVALAELRPLVIAAVMLVGWIIVALLEWAASREQPHYGSGLPPRYYVPQVAMPPRRPLEQVGSIYPASERRDEAPTWIAPPDLRDEVIGGWPVAPPREDEARDEEPVVPELPVEAAAEEAEPVQQGLVEEPDVLPTQPAAEQEPEPVAAVPEPEPVAAVPEPEPVAAVPESVGLEPEPLVELEPEPPVEPAPKPEPEPELEPAAELAGAGAGAVDVDGEQLELPAESPDDLPARGGQWWRRRRTRDLGAGDGAPAAVPDAVAVAEPAAPENDAETEPAKTALPRIIRLRARPVQEAAPAPSGPDAVAPGTQAVAPPTAKHRLDPLPDPEPRRWPWKRQHDERAVAEVPARPTGVRVLPGRSRRGR